MTKNNSIPIVLLSGVMMLISTHAIAVCSNVTIKCTQNITSQKIGLGFSAPRKWNENGGPIGIGGCELMQNNSYWVGKCNSTYPDCAGNCRAEQK